MWFTFYNSYIILRLAPNTVIFWTVFSWWHKIYSKEAMLLLDWSRPYKNYMVVITNWLVATKYPFLKWPWIFCFLCRCVPFFTVWVKRSTLRQNLGSPLLVECVAHFFKFLWLSFLVFVLCLVLTTLTVVSLDCPFSLASFFSL